MRTANTVLVASCLLLAGLPLAADDLAITYKVTTEGGAQETSTTYITSQKYRHASGGSDVIMEYATGRMISIDNKKKEYWEATTQEMAAAMEKAGEGMKRAQEQLKQNPQAAKMMESLMGSAMGQVTVTKGTASRKIAGYDCDTYVIAFSEMVKTETCNTTALSLPQAAVDAYKSALTANPMFSRQGAALAEKLSIVKGFPLAETTTTSILGRSSKTVREATDVKQGPVPATAFDIPAGYKKVESPVSKMSKGGRP